MTSPRIELPQRYRVLRHVATGGMATVYAAADEVLGREVAIKVLGEALAADDSARRRFTREARAAARVSDHPHVVTVFDIAETDGDPPVAFIVMELLTGGTINDRLQAREPIPHTLALRWLAETASALDAAHAAGMVHRDVKPANLLLDAKGTLKVADFGIATLATEAPLTMTGQVVGTAAYFSPEQAMGKPATAASDRYALAVVAFELLTGRRPFTGAAPAAQALAHVDEPPPAATSMAPGLPTAVDEVLARGMAKDPEARPATAAMLVEELAGALGPTAATGVAHPVGETATVAAPPTPPRPRRRAGAAAAAAAPVAAGIAEPSAAQAAERFSRPASPPPPRRPLRADPVAAEDPARRSRTGIVVALLALLLLAGAAIAALAGSGGGSPAHSTASRPATTKKHAPKRRTTSTPAAHTTASAPAAAAPAATTAAPAVSSSGGVPADASGIQARAHSALLAGDYQSAVAQLRGLVNRCNVQLTDPCAYAWFDYGSALRRGGDPQDAVGALEHRLQNPDQQATVQRELDLARAQAGSGGSAAAPAPGGNGKAKGHFKGD